MRTILKVNFAESHYEFFETTFQILRPLIVFPPKVPKIRLFCIKLDMTKVKIHEKVGPLFLYL